jgi:sugar O-acyltransferase (sialic acid O-acetyltransferase NeuD family)
MIKKLALIGASGHGKVVADIAKAIGILEIIFYDDRWQEIPHISGFEIVGSVADGLASDSENDYQAAVVTIGHSATRCRIQQQLKRVAPALVHPSAVVSPSVKIGLGSIIMPNAVINADAIIGQGVIVNSGAVIEHDCVVGDFSHICPNAALAGGVIIGNQSWIGIGSSVIQLAKVGSNVTVGAGAVVIKHIADHQTVVGNPAKSIHRKDV